VAAIGLTLAKLCWTRSICCQDALVHVLHHLAVLGLGLLQRARGGLAARDVAHEGAERQPRGGLHRPHREFHLEAFAVAAHRLGLDAPVQDARLASIQVAPQPGRVRGVLVVRHDQLGERAPERLLAAPAEHPLGRMVPVDHRARGVDGDHRIAGRGKQGLQARGGVGQAALRVRAAGDLGAQLRLDARARWHGGRPVHGGLRA
jgi:hypothetical protein